MPKSDGSFQKALVVEPAVRGGSAEELESYAQHTQRV